MDTFLKLMSGLKLWLRGKDRLPYPCCLREYLLNSCSGPGSMLGTEDTKMRTSSCLFSPRETLVQCLSDLCVLGSHVRVNANSGVFSYSNFNSLGWGPGICLWASHCSDSDAGRPLITLSKHHVKFYSVSFICASHSVLFIKFFKKCCLKDNVIALTGVAQFAGHCPAKRKVAGSFPVRAHAWVVYLVFCQGT